MCNGIRNSPIDVDFGGLTEEAEADAFMDPLTFTNYASVRYIGVGNVPEHEDGIDPLFALVDPYARAKKLSNKGGHTAVSRTKEEMALCKNPIKKRNTFKIKQF